MKSTRFQILMTMLVTLVASGLTTDQLAKKLDDNVVKAYSGNGLNAPMCATAGKLTEQRVRLQNGTGGYIAANIGKGGKNTDLIDVNTKRELGVSSFGDKLKPGELLIFDRLIIEHATNSTAGTPVKDVTGWSKSLPEELKNAEIEISTNGKVVFKGFIGEINDAQNNADKPYYQLFDPAYLLDDKEWQVTIKMPKQFTDTNDHYVRVVMSGATTYIG